MLIVRLTTEHYLPAVIIVCCILQVVCFFPWCSLFLHVYFNHHSSYYLLFIEMIYQQITVYEFPLGNLFSELCIMCGCELKSKLEVIIGKRIRISFVLKFNCRQGKHLLFITEKLQVLLPLLCAVLFKRVVILFETQNDSSESNIPISNTAWTSTFFC